MTNSHDPGAPAVVSAGAPSWAYRFNVNTPHVVAAVARVTAILGVFGEFGSLLGAIWMHGPYMSLRWGLTAGLIAALTMASAWLGFAYLKNPEWEEDRGGPADPG